MNVLKGPLQSNFTFKSDVGANNCEFEPLDKIKTIGQWPYRTSDLRDSGAKSGLRFDISDLNYLHIHVHIAYMV